MSFREYPDPTDPEGPRPLRRHRHHVHEVWDEEGACHGYPEAWPPLDAYREYPPWVFPHPYREYHEEYGSFRCLYEYDSGSSGAAGGAECHNAGRAWPFHPRQPSPRDSRPLRVIHVSYAMMPAGIDKWFTGLIRQADPSRLQFVRCVVTGGPVDLKQIARMGIPVEVGGASSVRKASQDCDVLLVSDPGACPDWIDQVTAPLRVFVAHGDGPWTRERLANLAQVIDHVVAVSTRVKERICEGHPTTVITNGVDPLHLCRSRPRGQTREALGFGPDDFVLGFVGRFSHEKNPQALIDAVARLPDRFKALMVGFGPLYPSLLQAANDQIPGRYVFVRGDDYLGDLHGAMDAFCLASFTEGFGLAIMEAMMCGRPVIVSDVGLTRDGLIDRVNALIVEGDGPSIARAALQLEAHPDWAAALGAEARAHADREGHAFTMAQRYADLLESLWRARHGQLPGRGPVH